MTKYVIIMCANILNTPTPLLVTSDKIRNVYRIESIFENRVLKKHTFDAIYDMIEGYGTKVYKIIKNIHSIQNETKRINTMNYVANPSFEHTYNVGIPNGVSIVWQNNYGSSIKVDSRISVHEFHSLRNIISDDYAHVIFSLCNPDTPGDLCDFKLNSNKTFEISLWAKSIKNYKTNEYPNISIIMEGSVPILSKQYTLSDEWVLYSYVGYGNDGPIGYNITKGITWVDLIQVIPLQIT